MTRRRPLTDYEVRQAHAVYLKGVSLNSTAAQYGLTVRALILRFRALNLPYSGRTGRTAPHPEAQP